MRKSPGNSSETDYRPQVKGDADEGLSLEVKEEEECRKYDVK